MIKEFPQGGRQEQLRRRDMLLSAQELQGYAIHARDGDLGKVRTFYFDEEEWCIHSMVADTASWFSGKYVLLPTDVLGQPDLLEQRLSVDLTQEEVRNSPEVPKHTAASGYEGTTMRTYAGSNVYWSTDPFVLSSVAARPASMPIPAAPAAVDTAPRPADMQGRGGVLHSTRDIMNYYIQATDGQIGHVEDFVIDTATWHIRYMVVDTRNWWPGKKVLVSPLWIDHIDWDTTQVTVNLSRERIKSSPEYDVSVPLDRSYETRLFDHYSRPKYWSDDHSV
jgi:sporulation protein YlmC with PRC-barrel domain